MIRKCAAALVGAAILFSAPALAQNLALRAPAWAQALVSADVTPTTGGRAFIVADDIPLAVRVTIAPNRGGVARVIRYDVQGDHGLLAVRRFTGHPSTGWWLWGGDFPRVTEVTPAQRGELAVLVRAASSAAAQTAGAADGCSNGEQAYLEVAVEGRATALTRTCLVDGEAGGRLALRLSALAGSRTEEELAAAAVTELMEADRAFSARAQADGVPAAFNAFAAADAVIITGDRVYNGSAGVANAYQGWQQGAQLTWAPETARVSARGDMGWTWGNYTHTAADGTRRQGRYMTVWTRDYEGNWRFAFDAAVR